LLALVIAGSLIRVPAPGAETPEIGEPDKVATVNLWERALLGFAGWTPGADKRWETPVGFVQQAYEQHVAGIFARKLMAMELPDDVAESIDCYIEQMMNGPDLLRARGMVGGFGVSPERAQWYWDQAQFGWKPIRDQLSSIDGLPLDSAVKPVEELTQRERALLAPSYELQGYLGARSRSGASVRVDEFARTLPWSAKAMWSARGYVTSTLGPEGYVAMVEAKRAFSKDEADRWLARNLLVKVASPVTGRVFEPDHPEFSAGNGYIREITDPQEIARLQQAVKNAGITVIADNYIPAEDGHDWSTLERVIWLYFRIYGESEIIAEGVYIHDPAGYPPAALRYMGDPEKLAKLIGTSLMAARQSATDYEEWLATQSYDELAAVFASRYGWVEALATPRDLVMSEDDVSLNKLRRGNVRGLRDDTIAGLPLNDPLPAIEDVRWDERILIASALTGKESALEWFRQQGVVKLNRVDWVKHVLSSDELRGILRSWSKLSGREMRLYLPDSPRPYNTGAESFLPIYRDFEPYQGYFERITDTNELARIERAAGHPVTDAIYFRLYGENRVIAEGVWAE